MPRRRSAGRWRADAGSCRFILSCNYSSKIIDPIQSRCAIYRFRPLDRTAIAEEIRRIAGREGLTISDGALDAIVYIAQGDMRKAINALQGAAILSPTIEEKMVYEITSNARPEEIRELLDLSLAGDFEGAERVLDRLLRERGIAPAELLGPVLPRARLPEDGPRPQGLPDRQHRGDRLPALGGGRQRDPDGGPDRAVRPHRKGREVTGWRSRSRSRPR